MDTNILRKTSEKVLVQEETPHACYEGWVFLGFMTEEDGELVEITDRVRCRRCLGNSR